MLIVLQGIDAAGKDGTIRHVMDAFNPQGCSVVGFKVPDPARARPRLPVAGPPATPRRRATIAIFNRSPLRGRAGRPRPRPRPRVGLAAALPAHQRLGADAHRRGHDDRQVLPVHRPGRADGSASRRASTTRPSAGSSRRATSPERARWDDYIEAFEECLDADLHRRRRPGTSSRPTASGSATSRSRTILAETLERPRSAVPGARARHRGPRRRLIPAAPPFGPDPTGPLAHRRRQGSCLRSGASGNLPPRPIAAHPIRRALARRGDGARLQRALHGAGDGSNPDVRPDCRRVRAQRSADDELRRSHDRPRSGHWADSTKLHQVRRVRQLTRPIASVKLRLFSVDQSNDGGTLRTVSDTSWAEGGVTWNSQPAMGSSLGNAGSTLANAWVEFDVSGVVTGNGVVQFRSQRRAVGQADVFEQGGQQRTPARRHDD